MNSNKILIGGLIGGVVFFLLGWLIYGIIFKEAMASPIPGFMKPESEFIWPAMILSNLIWGYLFAYIFGKWGSISTAMGGAIAGATIGGMISLSYNLGFYAMSNMFTLNTMLMDVVIATIMSAIVGAVIGWWLGRP
ncbi:MAG: hypothetical protein M3Q56_11705 [Bacteroidota bacterium]|nr:hypothetical protein [Bacteroidota bacterium]